jgi:KDO2-lipid IV(A) lauroyltransferase
MTSRKDVADSVTNWVYSAGWAATKRLPERAAQQMFRTGADILWRQDAGGVDQLSLNLARVCPDLDPHELKELTRAGMRSYMRYWCEAFRLPTMSPEYFANQFQLRGVELLDQGMDEGNGVLMIPGHMANWDLAGAWGAQRFGRVTTVVERLKPEKLFDQFLQYRELLGMEALPLGDSDVMRNLVDRLKSGGLVALLGDRDISGRGIAVDFFGETAGFPAGPATLAILTGAPLYPVTMHFEGPISVGVVHDRVEIPVSLPKHEWVANMTQQIARAFEVGIAKHPEDWHMLQKVWLADRKPR